MITELDKRDLEDSGPAAAPLLGFERLRDLGLGDDEVASFRATFYSSVMELDSAFPRQQVCVPALHLRCSACA